MATQPLTLLLYNVCKKKKRHCRLLHLLTGESTCQLKELTRSLTTHHYSKVVNQCLLVSHGSTGIVTLLLNC